MMLRLCGVLFQRRHIAVIASGAASQSLFSLYIEGSVKEKITASKNTQSGSRTPEFLLLYD
jgi:hypothetical protein